MGTDFNKLRLKYHGSPEKLNEILQAECRYKTAAKLPDTLANPDFIFPSLAVAEMATSDAVAEIHAGMIVPGESVLDMTCGLGIDTFHIAGRASSVTTVELNHESYEAACHNVQALGTGNVTVIEGDSVKWLEENDRHFDTIFIDPARRDSAGRHFELKDCRPDVTASLSLLLERCNRLIIKCSPMVSIDAAIKELGVECDVTLIGTHKECKEVVLVHTKDVAAADSNTLSNAKGSRLIRCVTVGKEEFSFTTDDERDATAKFDKPAPGGYLYEPYPSVMKGGGYRTLSSRFGIHKLHPNTHLYYSPEPIAEFPGEPFKIEEIIPFSKQEIKAFAKQYPQINVSTRNFPLSAPELVKKLKVKEGGSQMVFGTTDCNAEKILIVVSLAPKS